MKLTRREFLRDAGLLVAAMGLGPALQPQVAAALEELASGRAPLLWLQGQSCSGCSVSLLNADSPGPAELITRYLSLYFHQTLSSATGETALATVEKAIGAGNYILAVEGSVPSKIPEACKIGEQTFETWLLRAAKQAKAVVSVGTCASFGGIPAAPPNLTGAVPVGEILQGNGVNRPLINLPGCPAHPAWIVGTLVHVLKLGIPELDEFSRPKRTYGQLIHDQCPFFAKYQAKQFAQALGEEGCQFKLGCQGVVTKADCSLRGWNSGVNWCVRAHSVCVGCARPEFARDPNYPFYRLNEQGENA